MRTARGKGQGTTRKPDARGAASRVVLCFSLLAPVVALAQTNDPTRPPEGLSAANDRDAGDGGGPTLQSVMISPSGRAAINSGVTVRLGQKYGDAVLVKVAESEVVLKGVSGTQVLKLHPAVDLGVAVADAPRGKAPRKSGARAGATEEKGK
jgi:MSHA biogenesis protein MshK